MAEIRVDFQKKTDSQIQAERSAAYAQKLNDVNKKQNEKENKDDKE